MANPISTQNQQTQMNTQDTKAGIPKRLSRRNWLGNAVIMATTAVVSLLFLSGCTKEQWDQVTGHLPGGGVGAEPAATYVLKVTYQDERGVTKVGYLGGIANDPAFSFYDYMQISASGWKFTKSPAANGFEYWQFAIDNNYLSLRYNGWAYRSYQSNRIGWKIVNGKLYSDYDRWKDYPLGTQFRQDLDLIPAAYYVGVNLANNNVFTCELVPSP